MGDPMKPSPDYVLTVDLGHPPRPAARVEADLEALLMKVRNSHQYRAIKVIHGYGSHGRGGSTRETVRDWAYNARKRLRATITGESYGIFDDDTQEMRDECGKIDDHDLNSANSGITILWVK